MRGNGGGKGEGRVSGISGKRREKEGYMRSVSFHKHSLECVI